MNSTDKKRPHLVVTLLLALSLGVLQALSVALPWTPEAMAPSPTKGLLTGGQAVWWLQIAAMSTLLGLLHRSTQRRHALWLVGFFTTAWLTGCIWWLFISMNTYGGLPAVVAALAVLLLAAAMALFYVLALAVYWHMAPKNRLGAALVFMACWTMAELARGSWFTGFPWGAIGYAHIDGWLAAFAPWVGVYGMSALAALSAGLIVGLLVRQTAPQPSKPTMRWGQSACAACLVGLLLAAMLLQNFASPQPDNDAALNLPVTLLQGNIPQDEKFQPGTGGATALKWYGDELLKASNPLVVTPEITFTELPQNMPPDVWTPIEKKFTQGAQALIIGMPLGQPDTGYSNAALGYRPGVQQGLETPYLYTKHHLVPFGEFVPPGFRWFVDMMHIPLGDFNRGSLTQPLLQWQGQRLAPNICYEDLFGEELAKRFSDAEHSPTILVNLSNIAWFGNSVAIDQHLNISRMRALELDRPVIRATNTGATVIINHLGQVTASVPRHTRAALNGTVQGRSTPPTFYARWVSSYGLWPLWVVMLTIVFTAFGFRQWRITAANKR